MKMNNEKLIYAVKECIIIYSIIYNLYDLSRSKYIDIQKCYLERNWPRFKQQGNNLKIRYYIIKKVYNMEYQ